MASEDSGNGHSTLTIPVSDNMMDAAYALKENLTQWQWDHLFESMIYVVQLELTDADYGIVDADPVGEAQRQPLFPEDEHTTPGGARP